MTIQEYKEKIIQTIEQMEEEHNISVNSVEVVKCDNRWALFDKNLQNLQNLQNLHSNDKWSFKMVTR